MKPLLIIYITLFLTLLYFTLPKRLHLLEQWFIWMVFVFCYSSYISAIVDNEQLWVLSDKEVHNWFFKVTQIVLLPIMVLFFLNLFNIFKKVIQRILLSSFFIGNFLIIEWLLIYTDIITIRDWSTIKSITSWVIIILVMLVVHKLFRQLLVKEEVIVK